MGAPDAGRLADVIGKGHDFEVFCREVLGLRLNRAQERLARRIRLGPDRRWPFKTVMLVAGNQTGKAQPIDEPVLTPDGWRAIGSLAPGDEIIAGDGSTTTVVGVFPQGVKPIYRLTFDDGSWTRSCEEHLWDVREPRSRFRKSSHHYRRKSTLTLGALRKRYGDRPIPSRRWSIPAPGRIEHPKQDLPIDPYVLGVLLGDGSFRHAPMLSSADPEIIEAVRDGLPGFSLNKASGYDYRITFPGSRGNPLKDALIGLGLWGKLSQDKHIPEAYLVTPYDDRMALLQGLLDTDGTIDTAGYLTFDSSSPRLAAGVVDLVRSVGGKAFTSTRQTKRLPSYRVGIRLPNGSRPFRLQRKAERVRASVRTRDRIIYEIAPDGDHEAVCISVAHPDQTYITRDYIVTHNTLLLAALMLWAGMYKIGVDPSDKEAWLKASYLWLHLAPVQQQAYHAFKDIRRLIKNEHPAQGSRGRFPTAMCVEAKVEKYYDGFVLWNGAELHFRTSEQGASAVLGYRAAGISFDEAAFESKLSMIVNEVLYMRLIASKGPLFLVSTPNGMNDYFDHVDPIQQGGEQVEPSVWARGDELLVWATVDDNLGFGLDQDEIARMERTLSPVTKEQQLRGAFLSPLEAFFVPQDIILRCFRTALPDEEPPESGHRYAIFWDPSVSGASDPTAAVVLDVTYDTWVGVYHRWYGKAMSITPLLGEIWRLHRYYHNHRDERNTLSVPTRAVTGFDATSMGGVIVKQLLSGLTPRLPINFGGNAVKVPSLVELRNRLTSGKVILPASWLKVRQELLNYRLKDDKIDTDCVMALMGACMVAKHMTLGQPVKASIGARISPKRGLSWT